MAVLHIITAPDMLLKQRSLPVLSVDNDIRKLMDDIKDTMYHDNGVGLAAVQVGVLQRVIVIDLQDDDDEKREKGFYPLFLANPELIEKSTEVCSAIEGCLSVPDQRVDIVRSSSIKIRFLNYHNEKIELKTGGWLARAIQHEMDHLDGKLMIDYLSSIKKDIVIRKLKKHKRNLL